MLIGVNRASFDMRRRQILYALGSAPAIGLAGCIGGDENEDQRDQSDTDSGDDQSDTDSDDDHADTGNDDGDSTDDAIEYEAANEFGYETLETDGVEVPLVPVADAIHWFLDDEIETVFADARHPADYEHRHIADAVLSPAPYGDRPDDPVESYDTDVRIVTYCVCPHSLATQRGANLISDGYIHTYALDEGFQEWYDEGYPVSD